jgi:hypothetical protein
LAFALQKIMNLITDRRSARDILPAKPTYRHYLG